MSAFVFLDTPAEPCLRHAGDSKLCPASLQGGRLPEHPRAALAKTGSQGLTVTLAGGLLAAVICEGAAGRRSRRQLRQQYNVVRRRRGGCWLRVESLNFGRPQKQKDGAYTKRFRVDTLNKGQRSYGSIDEDDIAEAARIRAEYQPSLGETAQASQKRRSDARKRLLRQRLAQKKNFPWQSAAFKDALSSAKTDKDADKDDKGGSGDLDDGSGGGEGDDVTDGVDGLQSSEVNEGAMEDRASASVSTEKASEDKGTGSSSAGKVEEDPFAGFPVLSLSDARLSVGTSQRSNYAKADDVDLDTALRLAKDVDLQKKTAGSMLLGAAYALRKDGKHRDAALLLQELRDYGVERDMLKRGLKVQEAEQLHAVATRELGVQLRRAGYLVEAWKAFMEICNCERGQLGDARQIVGELASTALTLAGRSGLDPRSQVEWLQGTVDVDLEHRVLPADRRDEVELTLAMSLKSAGRSKDSEELLKRLSTSGSSEKRRGQADWILTVQKADISEEPSLGGQEMKKLWNENMEPLTAGNRTGGAGALGAAACDPSRSGNGAGMKFGSFGVAPLVMIFLMLAMPLAIPFLSSTRSASPPM
eukprot:TRINITY_DN51351_c0_g1_i1.p1 TRINITY_DN51351_c0_g1~~TRINITY_DN51351_c0_g1_i1.p1  ORF type:complete len:589 (+),score=123.85 TRINITY_DN51351_c0_g1_i1:79-1845(+)